VGKMSAKQLWKAYGILSAVTSKVPLDISPWRVPMATSGRITIRVTSLKLTPTESLDS